MRRKCRIWWPKQLASTKPSSNSLLFGCFVSCSSDSLDVIVAFASNHESSLNLQSPLQEILHSINGNMQLSLQEKSKFSLLGQYRACLSNGKVFRNKMEEDEIRKIRTLPSDGISGCCGQCSCGCLKHDGLLDQLKPMFIENNYWIELAYDSLNLHAREICWIPRLHHIHWMQKECLNLIFTYVIVYETPKYGTHHFSLGFWNSSEHGKTYVKKPQCFNELMLNAMDTVILAINSAATTNKIFKRNDGSKRSRVNIPIAWMFYAFMSHLFAMLIASLYTLFYTLSVPYLLAHLSSGQ